MNPKFMHIPHANFVWSPTDTCFVHLPLIPGSASIVLSHPRLTPSSPFGTLPGDLAVTLVKEAREHLRAGGPEWSSSIMRTSLRITTYYIRCAWRFVTLKTCAWVSSNPQVKHQTAVILRQWRTRVPSFLATHFFNAGDLHQSNTQICLML